MEPPITINVVRRMCDDVGRELDAIRYGVHSASVANFADVAKVVAVLDSALEILDAARKRAEQIRRQLVDDAIRAHEELDRSIQAKIASARASDLDGIVK